MAEPTYVPELLALLAERGPLTTPALAASLGVPEAELQREVQARPDLFETVDGWYSVWVLAEGVVLTHTVSEEELASGMLVPDGDLDLWTRLADSPVPLVGGGEVQARYHSDLLPEGASAVLVGPAGWLSGLAAGDLVAMRLVGGALSVSAVDQLGEADMDLVRDLVEVAAAMAREEDDNEVFPGAAIDDVVLEVLLRRPSAFGEPLPPTSVLLELAGLEVYRGLVGLSGTEWRGPDELFLDAQEALAAGDVARAESLLEGAESPEALRLAGDLAAERGEAFAADVLYRRAGDPVDVAWRDMLREFLQAPPGVEGRNRPCACGSGRKAKLCCGASVAHPLPRRAVWRYRRAALWALASLPSVDDPLELELELAAGLLGRYLAERGSLFPPDERALVEQWAVAPMELYEVVSVQRGRSVSVRSLPAGSPVTVRDRLLSGEVERLDLLLGRLLWDGTAPVFLNAPTWVPRGRRAAVLACLGSPAELLAALAPAGPPELRTREGEELLVCRARYAVPDVSSVWSALGLVASGEELLDLVTLGEEQVIRGWVRRTTDGLEIETNALERLRRLQERVLAAAPGARLVSESSVPLDLSSLPAPGPSGELPAEVLASFAEMAERRWLDEQIPALGGLTPREAAADPSARASLGALLDDFEWQERQGPSVMSAARLRAALGLGL